MGKGVKLTTPCYNLDLWPLTSINGVTGHSCHGLHSCQLSAC